MKTVHNILGYISQTKLFGWLPLDIVMHVTLGMLITVIAYKKLKSVYKAFAICLVLALAKELFDSQSLTASWGEAIKDIAVTMVYPLLLILIFVVRKKMDREYS